MIPRAAPVTPAWPWYWNKECKRSIPYRAAWIRQDRQTRRQYR